MYLITCIPSVVRSVGFVAFAGDRDTGARWQGYGATPCAAWADAVRHAPGAARPRIAPAPVSEKQAQWECAR